MKANELIFDVLAVQTDDIDEVCLALKLKSDVLNVLKKTDFLFVFHTIYFKYYYYVKHEF